MSVVSQPSRPQTSNESNYEVAPQKLFPNTMDPPSSAKPNFVVTTHPPVADRDIVADWTREQKLRKAERDRQESKRIEGARDREIEAFKANIADVRIVRDIGNAVEIDVKYINPILNKSRIIEDDDFDELNDFFKIFSMLRSKLKEQQRTTELYEREITENQIRVKMDVKPGDTFVRMISGGNYDFRDGTTRGYWLIISLANYDEILLRILVKACKKLGFVFMTSPSSATGLLQRSNISYEDMGRLQDKVKDKIIEELPKQQQATKNTNNSSSCQGELPPEVPRKVVDSILSRLADIMIKEVNQMIRKGNAYDEREAKAMISYDNYILELSKLYNLPGDTVSQIISYWVSIQHND